ncbi:6292_t:CDS:1, partial [Scutellospora calospora]
NKKHPDNFYQVITLLKRDYLLFNLHSSSLEGHFETKRTIEQAI